MKNVRRAAFSGSWYPDSASACEREIQSFLKKGITGAETGRFPIAGIVPHAGWYFSGGIACQVIHTLLDQNPPDVVAVFGMHLGPGSPCYLMSEGGWETPFGPLLIDSEIAHALLKQFSFKLETVSEFTPDNTIELQLPFIKYFSALSTIVPLGVPPREESLEIGRAVVKAAEETGKTIKVIGSTDLTHYGDNYGFSPKGRGESAVKWVRNENDQRIIDTMVQMNSKRVITEALSSQNACCAGAAAAAIEGARQLGAEFGKTLTYATSYDKSPGSSFVGYAGILFAATKSSG